MNYLKPGLLALALASIMTLATIVSAITPTAQASNGIVNYTPGALKAAIAKGETVLVDYKATW